MITLMALDARFARKLLELKPETIGFLLGSYLTKDEIKACQDRLKGIQELIRQLEKQEAARKKDGLRPRLISDEDGWLKLRDEIEEQRPAHYSATDSEQKKDQVRKSLKEYGERQARLNQYTLADAKLRRRKPTDI